MKDKVIISLSTIPPRFRYLGETLNCILDQELPADEIQVFIPQVYKRFPQHAFSIPEIPLGGGKIKIKIVDNDLGPATKVLYCAEAHWGTRTRIIYCDDDRLPDPTWLKSIILATDKNPENAIVSAGFHFNNRKLHTVSDFRFPRAEKRRVIENLGYVRKRILQKLSEAVYGRPFQKPSRSAFKRSGYVDIAAGLGGVSIKPDFFGRNAFEIPEILWTVDDIWLSGLLEHRGIGIWAANSIPIPVDGASASIEALCNFVLEHHDRHQANLKCVKYMQDKYSIWQ